MSKEETIGTLENAKHFTYGDEKFNDAFDSAINYLKETMWIPVTERLPEEDGDYLVCIKGTVANINGDIQNFFKWLQDSWFLNWIDDCVIAWMPSPKQYEGE